MGTIRSLRNGVLFAVVVLAGCQKEATGQVAAVVNGDEITLQEVNAEMSSMQVPQGADRVQIQKAALQRVIDRRLLAQAARDDGLDKTPEFLVRRRQLEDALLVQLLSQRVGRSVAVPDTKAIDAYTKQNPAVFSGRTIFTIDRIQFAAPADPTKLKALQDDHSMDAVASRLQQLGIEFNRDTGQMDSAQLGQERLDRIRSLPAGEPFVLADNGLVTVAVITGSKPLPIEGDAARPAAVQLLRNQSLTAAMQQRLAAQKAAAKIKYQDAFLPPASGAANAPKPG